MISLKVLIVYGKFKSSTVTIAYPENKFETEENGIQNEDKNLDSDEGIKIDSGRGTKIFLNRRPSGSYVVEIVGEKNSDIEHPSENIRRITTSKNSAYFARDIDTSIVETARSLPSSD